METIVYEQLSAYLEEHDVLCRYQSGFRAIFSAVTALREATDSWAYNKDIAKIIAVIFGDLKKGFDTADHDILLSKLDLNGTSGNSLK